MAAFHAEQRVPGAPFGLPPRQAERLPQRRREALGLAAGGHIAGRAHGEPDPFVPQLGQVAHRHPGRRAVVG